MIDIGQLEELKMNSEQYGQYEFIESLISSDNFLMMCITDSAMFYKDKLGNSIVYPLVYGTGNMSIEFCYSEKEYSEKQAFIKECLYFSKLFKGKDFSCICVVSDSYVLDLSVRCGYIEDITVSELYKESDIELYGKGLILLV